MSTAKLESLDSVKAIFCIRPDEPHSMNIQIIVPRRYWENAGMPTEIDVDFYSGSSYIDWGFNT